MKFIIESVSKCSGRLGVLTGLDRLPEKSFKTPLLLFTDHNLSREILDIAGFQNFGVLLAFDSVQQMGNALKLYKKGISEFIGLGDCLTFLTIKNCTEASPSGHHEKGSIPIFRKAGKLNIRASEYMNFVDASNPDFFVNLTDGDTWNECSKKRIVKSIERSEEMFDECTKYYKEVILTNNKSCKLIASVEGAYSEHERKKCAEYILMQDEILEGYFIDGFHRNGSEATKLENTNINDLVKSTLSILPEHKMKMMFGPYPPQLILQFVKYGIDIFDSSFVNLVTKMNRALTFSFHLNDPTIGVEPEIDLMDMKYKEDFSPLVESCDCLACKQHTKAYINHLLITKELLGPMLLTIHNLHHYKKFFDAMYMAIKEDKLAELISLIENQYKKFNLSYDPPIPEKLQNKSNDQKK